MQTPSDGGPAFPRTPESYPERDAPMHTFEPGAPGMTLEDWFAGVIACGMYALGWKSAELRHQDATWMRHDDIARSAYFGAAAMLVERNKVRSEREGNSPTGEREIREAATESANSYALSFLRKQGHDAAADALERDLEIPF